MMALAIPTTPEEITPDWLTSALAAGGLTDKVILEAGRLTGLRGHDGGNTAAGKE